MPRQTDRTFARNKVREFLVNVALCVALWHFLDWFYAYVSRPGAFLLAVAICAAAAWAPARRTDSRR